MNDRIGAGAAVLVGIAVAIGGGLEFVRGFHLPDPFVSGLFVCGAGTVLVIGGGASLLTGSTPIPLVVASVIGLFTLAGVMFVPGSLLFGGVFWLALLAFVLVAAGVYPAVASAISDR